MMEFVKAAYVKPYFASGADGSEAKFEAISLGLMSGDEKFFQLQRNDSVRLFECDEDVVRRALKDAENGDAYAIEQLEIAKTDPLVHRLRQEMNLSPSM